MKFFLAVIILLIALLQYRLWFSNGGIEQIQQDQLRLVELKKQVEEKRERNAALYAEVEDLRLCFLWILRCSLGCMLFGLPT